MQRSGARLAARTLVQKILQRHVVGAGAAEVQAGDFVSLRPKHVMTHDNSYHVLKKFRKLGAARVRDPAQLVFALDHDIQNRSEANLKRYAAIEDFAREQGVDFYPAGRGIGHQVMVEELYAEPGSLCVASDSHSNMYGGLGCLGTPVVRTDAASIWATGRTWWRVPPIAHVELVGALPPGCSGKDVIVALCSALNKADELLNHALEFGGEGVAALSVEERLTVANMSTEAGALCGLFPSDAATRSWWAERAGVITQSREGASVLPSAEARAARARELFAEAEELSADAGARYAKRFRLDLSKLAPLVTGGNSLKHAEAAAALQGTKIQKAWLVSCVNARAGDLALAAKELRGSRVKPWVEFYVAPASSEVQAEAEAKGDWQALMDAGAIALPAGCGACAGLGAGTIKAGEVGVAATNRNFKGRMGSPQGVVHLTSPAVVAASAREGFVTAPAGAATGAFEEGSCVARLEESAGGPQGSARKEELVPGFPRKLAGELVWCGADNISTDGIYHGKHMYEDLSEEEMANVAMENYDPDFREVAGAAEKPVLAAGSNFGTGSSREQAAQCLKFLGLECLLAGSYSATYTRNALNNGLPLFESPELVDFLRKRFGSGTEAKIETPTVPTRCAVHLDLRSWEVELSDEAGARLGTFPLVPMGQAAQELIACGGLEAWIRAELGK